MICPFFGKNEDYCDIGCGYISPSDVKKIIQFCSDHPDRCPVFQDLIERHPEEALPPFIEATPPVLPPAAPLAPQLVPSAPTQTSRCVSKLESQPGPHRPRPDTDILSNPSPIGLLAFGLTTTLFSLYHTGTYPLDNTMLAMGVGYGGLIQIIVGFMEWKRQHAFGATAFTSFGLFWLSLLAITIISDTRFIELPKNSAMTAYLILWGLFSAILFVGALKLNRSLQCVLGSLTLLFLLFATGTATGSPAITIIAGWAGVSCGLAAIYTGLAQILNDVLGRAVVPLGEHKSLPGQRIHNRLS